MEEAVNAAWEEEYEDCKKLGTTFNLNPELILKLRNVRNPENLVYEWVKTHVISLKEFKNILIYLVES